MTAVLSKTREQEIIEMARAMTGTFGLQIDPVWRNIPQDNKVAIRIMLPSHDVTKPEQTGAQVDYVLADFDWSNDKIMGEVRSLAKAMIDHEFDENFLVGGERPFIPSHDPAILGSMRHWTNNNCLSADVRI